MKDTYAFKKDYKDIEALRTSFNGLAERTFKISFEDWYRSGYWREKYIPYSITDGNQVVANISVSIMDFFSNGEIKHYIQLGTVMTDKEYQNQGLSRYLMEEILKEFKDKVDGIYLFANDSVLEFYPKFGFRKCMEYEYSKTVEIDSEKTAVQAPMMNQMDIDRLEEVINSSICNGRFEMDNIGLIMFYIISFMRESVYYLENLNAYVIADVDDETLILYNVFCKEEVNMSQIIEAFGKEIKEVKFGFTPFDMEGYCIEEKHEKNTTLFVMGKDFDDFVGEQQMFPLLSHA